MTELNVRILVSCNRCKKEYDRTKAQMFEEAVKCECGGWIITPSGKSQMRFEYTKKMFVLKGSKLFAYITAKTEQEAIDFFNTINDDIVNDIREFPRKKFHKMFIYDPNPSNLLLPDEQKEKITFQQLVMGSGEAPLQFHVSNLDDIQ